MEAIASCADIGLMGEGVANRTVELARGGWGSSIVRGGFHLNGECGTAQWRASFLDRVPAMSTTALAMEILLNEPSIDLSAAAELVLSDVGATIQILRLSGGDYCAATDRPSRMVDCLSSLDASEWLRAITRRTFVCDRAHLAEAALWKRCRTMAQYTRLAAESVDSISPEDAYLAGLLYDVSALAKLVTDADDTSVEVRTAEAAIRGVMPLFVLDALDRSEDASSSNPWGFILNVAYALAVSSDDPACALEKELAEAWKQCAAPFGAVRGTANY